MSTPEEFESRLRESIADSIGFGYVPVRFADMVDKWGGVQTAKKLVLASEIQDGARQSVAIGHPELLMEVIMLRPEFETLFTLGELDAARWRIEQLMLESSNKKTSPKKKKK